MRPGRLVAEPFVKLPLNLSTAVRHPVLRSLRRARRAFLALAMGSQVDDIAAHGTNSSAVNALGPDHCSRAASIIAGSAKRASRLA